jgi:EcsC family protein
MLTRSLAGRGVEELAVRLTGATDFAIDEMVRRRARAIRSSVEFVRLQNPDATPDEVARNLVYQRSRLSAIAGGVSAVPGAIPGLGTATEIGASLADVALLVYTQVGLVMAVAAAYDHDLTAYDDRAADVRVVLALASGVARFGKRGAELADGTRLDPRHDALSEDVNRAVGELVVRRTARSRARMVIGREIPFGIGIAIGAGANYRIMRHTGRTALRYYGFTANATARS